MKIYLVSVDRNGEPISTLRLEQVSEEFLKGVLYTLRIVYPNFTISWAEIKN